MQNKRLGVFILINVGTLLISLFLKGDIQQYCQIGAMISLTLLALGQLVPESKKEEKVEEK